jgi:DNA-binding NarL/FixJ family response regulator
MSLQLSPGTGGDPYNLSQVAAVVPTSLGRRARVLLVEDHPVYSAGLQALLEGDAGFEVVGQVADGEAAMPLVRRCQPDVIILDIGLGGTNGLDLINRFRRINSDVRIAVLTAHEEREHLLTALRLGVQAFIQKDVPGSAILAAMRQVLNGERVVTQPSALTTALAEFGHLLQEHERERSMLTAQELEILRLAAAGLKNKDIGAHQFLSEVTIKRKLQDIYRKLNVSGKAAAVAEAMRLGWI